MPPLPQVRLVNASVMSKVGGKAGGAGVTVSVGVRFRVEGVIVGVAVGFDFSTVGVRVGADDATVDEHPARNMWKAITKTTNGTTFFMFHL